MTLPSASPAPRVTVLMAVWNGARFVEEAVASILRQTFKEFEFLIIDDASTDDTPERLRRFSDDRIQLIRNPSNIGLTRSLNRGLALARGSLVARQDADDVSHPRRLEAQVGFLDAEPGVAVVGAQARTIDGGGREVRTAPWPRSTSAEAIRWQLLFDSPFVHTSVMFRRDVIWAAAHGYDERFATSQDFELWCRVSAQGREMRNLPDRLVDFRLHEESVSRRYALDGVAKVGPVLRQSLVAQLGPEAVPAGWPDMWIRVTNPQLFPGRRDSPQAVAAALAAIHARFLECNPTARDNQEIARHLAAMLIRVALSGSEHSRLPALATFVRAWRVEGGTARQSALRFGVVLLLGRRRHLLTRAGRVPAPVEPGGARPALIRCARAIYRATPFAPLRRLYFRAFCLLMRNRRLQATIDGNVLELDLGEMIELALYLGQYEPEVTAALRTYCRAGMTALDIGANMGVHTFTLARLVTPAGAVYAFEPTDFAFAKLRRNVELNATRHIHPIKAAVSDRNAPAQPIAYRASWTTAGGRNDGVARADFLRLDDWAEAAGVGQVGLVKIDIDGNEFEALAGGRQLIARSRPVIVIEAVSPHFDDDAHNPFRLLEDLGYRFLDARSSREYDGVDALARLLPEADRAMTTSINLVAVPRHPERP
jgi:FkbM family methyltransferase